MKAQVASKAARPVLRQGRPKTSAKLQHDLETWPNHEFSSFVHAAGLEWHVQMLGRGPLMLLVHGAGAATHSWRDLAPLLATKFKVLAVDLPGHGFTDSVGSRQASLPGMAQALARLLRALYVEPDFAVGHSAGAAILVRMSLDGAIEPRAMMSLNGAFMPFGGVAGQIFSPLAKLLALNPFVPRLFAWSASDRGAVARVIRDTGSTLDRRGLDLYTRLFSDPRHVSGALKMMANWDLSSLAHDMRRLRTPLTLVVASGDRAVPPEQADAIAASTPGARRVRIAKSGHLAHEENPEEIARLIFEMAELSPEKTSDARG